MIMATANINFDFSDIIALVCAGIALLISGFISGSEIAYFSLTPSQLDELDDTPKGEKIRYFLDYPERLLATILIANNLVNVTIVILCNYALGPIFGNMPEVLSFILQNEKISEQSKYKWIVLSFPKTVCPLMDKDKRFVEAS